MTRLVTDQIIDIPEEMQSYDADLLAKTGGTLSQLAAESAGLKDSQTIIPGCRVAVIPVNSGQGTITGFSEAVCAIAAHLGFQAYITGFSDVGGLVEAYEKNADLVIMADDQFYAAINLNTHLVADNDHATAYGYAFALGKMAGGLSGKEVLLIGSGPVGREAGVALCQAGAIAIVYDLDKQKENELAVKLKREFGTQAVLSGMNLVQALERKPLIFDASPGDGFIPADLVYENTMVAAPGLPLGLDEQALGKVGKRLIHDPLQIGTAVMLFKALS
jgi:3-methylornithyl-N6-L-lysine dehydrogenase